MECARAFARPVFPKTAFFLQILSWNRLRKPEAPVEPSVPGAGNLAVPRVIPDKATVLPEKVAGLPISAFYSWIPLSILHQF